MSEAPLQIIYPVTAAYYRLVFLTTQATLIFFFFCFFVIKFAPKSRHGVQQLTFIKCVLCSRCYFENFNVLSLLNFPNRLMRDVLLYFHFIFVYYFFFFFFLFRAQPVTYGNSQARGQIGAAYATATARGISDASVIYATSCSNARS